MNEFDRIQLEELYEEIPEEIRESVENLVGILANPPEKETLIFVENFNYDRGEILFWADAWFTKEYASEYGTVRGYNDTNRPDNTHWVISVDRRYKFEEIVQHFKDIQEATRVL